MKLVTPRQALGYCQKTYLNAFLDHLGFLHFGETMNETDLHMLMPRWIDDRDWFDFDDFKKGDDVWIDGD